MMVLRLDIDGGCIREYRTWYMQSSDAGGEDAGCEPASEVYETGCGMHWHERPGKDDGCSHVDCAIEVIEKDLSSSKRLWIFLLMFCVMPATLLKNDPQMALFMGLLFGAPFLAIGALCSFKWHGEAGLKRELEEFRDHGTVNGIRAREIRDGIGIDIQAGRRGPGNR